MQLTDRPSSRALVTAAVEVKVTWPILIVLVTVLLTYGYELFNFHVSVDEPLYWGHSRLEMFDFWRARGRWGMGLTSLLVPSTVVPVVPVAVAIAGTATGLWVLSRRVLRLDEWGAALATAMAVTMPVLAFHIHYSINDIGLGVGFAACATSAVALATSGRGQLIVAVGAGAFATAIYESFAFALAASFLAVLWQTPTWRMVGRVVLVTALASVISLITRIAFTIGTPDIGRSLETAVGSTDTGSGGLGANLIESATRTIRVVLETPLYVGFSNPLPGLVAGALFVGAAVTAFRRSGSQRLISLLVLTAAVLLPVVCELITNTLHLRSMVYLPVLVVLVVGAGLPAWRSWGGPALRTLTLALAGLAIIGNASLANGVFYTGTFLTDQDAVTASQVIATYRSLPSTFEDPLVAVIAARDLEPARPPSWKARASFELGVMGNDLDALRFLQMQGMDVLEPTAAETELGLRLMDSMPAYPTQGYMQVREGLLLINLSTTPGR